MRLVLHPPEQRRGVEKVVLRNNHLDVVAHILDGAAEAGDDVAEPAHFGDGRHLDGDVHDVDRRRLGARADHVEVVVQSACRVVLDVLAVPAFRGEDKVNAPRIFGDDELARVVVAAIGARRHLERRGRLQVGPAVETGSHPHLGAPVEVGVLRVVVDLDGGTRLELVRLGVHDVLHLLAQHLERLLAHSGALRSALLVRDPRRLLRLEPLLANLRHAHLDEALPRRLVAPFGLKHLGAEVLAVVIVPRHLVYIGDYKVEAVRRVGHRERRPPPLVLVVVRHPLRRRHLSHALRSPPVPAVMDGHRLAVHRRVRRVVQNSALAAPPELIGDEDEATVALELRNGALAARSLLVALLPHLRLRLGALLR
mmetsp:Transcript_24785/g.81049  ORF Transcript_24785/g.81049 Transcript_24785/m.81049 type:complete len:368 (+) Transcript_24785:2816-3919(+)